MHRRFDELAGPTAQSEDLSTAGLVTVTIGSELRPVISQWRTLVQLREVQVATAGVQAFRVRELNNVGMQQPLIAAAVRTTGQWGPRTATLGGPPSIRTVDVTFSDADVGETLEVTISGWGPPRDVDATTVELTVPPAATLRFAVAAVPAPVARAHVRILVQPQGQPERALDERTFASPDHPAWQDVEISLAEFEGQVVHLRVIATVEAQATTKRKVDPRVYVSEPIIVVPSAPAKLRKPDNLILISIDTLRADHLGTYGYRRPVSPTLDRLAASGITFDQAFAVWPETSASHMTLFTGLYPSVHGIGVMTWGARVLPPWQLTLAEMVRRQGFVTAAITEDGLLLTSAGFARGFDSYREFGPQRATADNTSGVHPKDKLPVAMGHPGAAKAVFTLGADWLRRHQHDRFMLFLHTYQVHQRTAPGERYQGLRQSFVNDQQQPAITDPDSFLANYDASIAYTDDALSELLQTLDELQLARRTLLVVTSDHGEEFYEHGVFGHGFTLYNPALRVPLIFSCPGFVPAGNRAAVPVSLIDIAPTILDLLQLPAFRQSQGRGFADLVLAQAAKPRAAVVGELGDRLRAVRNERFKLIRTTEAGSERLEVFDLANDPDETHPATNVDGIPEARSALLALQAHDLECQSVRAQLQAAAKQAAPNAAAVLDEQTRQRLQALGYDAPAEH